MYFELVVSWKYFTFSSRQRLAVHVKRHSRGPLGRRQGPFHDLNIMSGSVTCPLCEAKHDDFDSFKNHVFAKHSTTKGEVGGMDIQLTLLLNPFSLPVQVSCSRCQSVHRTGLDLIEHLFVKHLMVNLTCGLCAFETGSVDQLLIHRKLDHRPNYPMCPSCGT